MTLGDYPGAVASNGIFRATALVSGRVAGTWTIPAGVVTVQTAQQLPTHVLAELQTEADDVLRFLGLPAAPMRIFHCTIRARTEPYTRLRHRRSGARSPWDIGMAKTSLLGHSGWAAPARSVASLGPEYICTTLIEIYLDRE